MNVEERKHMGEDETLRQRIQQEPVAWECDVLQIDGTFKKEIGYIEPPEDGVYYAIKNKRALTYCYESPPAQRTWVGLSEEEIENIFNNWPTYHLDYEDFARAIEAKLREKNP
jgi:hypothetical protein